MEENVWAAEPPLVSEGWVMILRKEWRVEGSWDWLKAKERPVGKMKYCLVRAAQEVGMLAWPRDVDVDPRA